MEQSTNFGRLYKSATRFDVNSHWVAEVRLDAKAHESPHLKVSDNMAVAGAEISNTVNLAAVSRTP